MREREEVFDHFITAVINTLNADEIYDAAIEALQDILQPDGLLLMMNQNTRHVFSVIRNYGDIAYTKSYSVPTDSMLQELKDAPNLTMLDDSRKHILALMTPRQREWLNIENITAIYTLKYNQVIIGFLYIATHDGQDLTPEEIKYLEKICYYSSYALRNANLYQNAYRASITDDLTSLYNRKHAFECIDNVCQHQKPSTLIVLDIDDFKLYNELYGAQESDNLIHRFAQVILQEISSKDIGFRFGADEFLILKAGTDIDEACSCCKRIVDAITDATPANTVWDITITCGISVFPDISTDAGLLHDIGKISIPERILQKTSKLTDEEYAIMKTHVENSTKMIRYLPDMDYVIPAVVGHHERYDGTGYPRGLAGQNIPYMARILTIADCFDAMTAKRPYKQALSVEYAVNELEKNSGTQFDPVLVKKFVELIHEGKISIA